MKSYSKFRKRKDHFLWNEGDLKKVSEFKEEMNYVEAEHTFENPKVFKHKHTSEFLTHHPDHSLSPESARHYEDHHNYNLGFNEKDHIDYYKGGSETFNSRLRQNGGKIPEDPLKPASSEHYQKVDVSMSKSTNLASKEDMHVWRAWGKGLPHSKLKPGEVYQDDGYAGTSFSREVASYFDHNKYLHHGKEARHYARIQCPKGTLGHFIDNTQATHGLKGEQEFVLHKGTKFLVLGHEKHETPYEIHHIVHMKVVGNGHADKT